MKKFILAAAACAALLTVSCNKESQVRETGTTFQASLSALTKTVIDGVKVSWAAGDAINVNGTGSFGTEAAGSEASFVMSAEVTAPYNATYPPGLYYGPDTIELSDYMFLEQVSMIPLAAYSASEPILHFSPITAIFKIPVTGADGATLKTVTFKSKGGEQISGQFTIDFTVPEITAGLDDTYQSVTVNCENAALGTTPIDIYIPVPAGTYSGFEIEVETSEGTVVKGTSARTLAVGELRAMPAIDATAAAPAGGIKTAEDLLAFAEAVNTGASLDAWKNADGEIELLADIDLASVTDWTPIGNVTTSGNGNFASKPEGPVFSGTFNGGDHAIKNFKASTVIPAGCTWGFFGCAMNATIKNLTLEADVTLEAAEIADAGVLVGTAYSTTIQSVQIKGKVDVKGTKTDNKRFAIGGIAGFVFSIAAEGVSYDSTIKDCVVDLAVTGNSGANVKCSAYGVHFGGIAGFCTNPKDDSRNHIEDCTFSGSLNIDCGRCAGIAGVGNFGTIFKGCVNNANQVNNFADGREAGVVCVIAQDCAMIDCVNNGNLTTTHAKTHAGGLFTLLNHATCYVEGGANYGTILCAFETDIQGRRFAGLVGANFSKFDHVSGVTVSGKIGTDANNIADVNAGNFMDYIGYLVEGAAEKITNLSYVAP